MSDKKLIELALKRFDKCVEAESINREHAIVALNFRYGAQWPESIKKERVAEGRPCLVLNRLPAFIRQVINDIRQTRPAIKVKGIDSESDPKTAEVMNGMIRAIEQASNAEIAYDWAAEYAVTMGWGYIKIGTQFSSDKKTPDAFLKDIVIKRVVNPFSVYLDPARQEPDGSDAKYAFVIEAVEKETFEAEYPKAKSEWDTDPKGSRKDKWYEKDKVWKAEYWLVTEDEIDISLMPDGNVYDGIIEGNIDTRKLKQKKVVQYIITGQEVLKKTEWAGKYIPIVPVLGEELNIEGETFLNGMVKDLMDPQRQYNYWRSANTERVALYSKAPWIGPEGTFVDPKWNSANKKNHAYLEYVDKGTPPQRTPPPDVSPGMSNEIATASQEFKEVSGIFDAGLGNTGNEVSGTAINARQRKGETSNFHYIDNLGRAMRQVGRILVDLIPHEYDTPRVTQILMPDGAQRKVTINAPGTDEKTEKPTNFNLQVGRYDAVVDIGPSFATQREESSQAQMELLKVMPQAANLIADLMVKNFDWPGAEEIARRFKVMLPAGIEQDENPQIKAIIDESKQQLSQAMQLIQQLQQALQEKDKELKDKQDDLAIKDKEVERKILADDDKLALGLTKLEIESDKNVPGSVV